LTTFLIDAAIIGIIAFCTWRGYRNGLIRGVFGVVALIVSLYVAHVISTAYSQEFTVVLKPFVGGIVDSALVEVHDEGVEYEYSGRENESGDFGTAFSVLRLIGLPESSAAHVAEQAVDDDSDEFLSDLIATKLSSTLAYVAVFGIAFVLLAIVFAVVGNLIGFVFSLPGLKLLDTIAGIAFGLAKGFLIVLALAAIVRYYGLLAVSTIEGTSILQYFVNNNLIAHFRAWVRGDNN